MSWYDSAGRESDVILGSSVTLIRNPERTPFPGKDPEKDAEIISKLASAFSDAGLQTYDLSSIGDAALRVFAEKRLIDRDVSGSGLLLLDEERGISITLGVRDHVRIKTLGSGESLEECLETAFGYEKMLDDRFELAYSESLGYLTSDPSFLGSAAGFSLIAHLPASGRNVSASRFVSVERLPGELFRISSPPYPGITEKEQIERLLVSAGKLASSERAERAKLRADSMKLCDRVMRAKGILSNALLMPHEEFTRLWSDLRLGAVSGFPELLSPEELGGIFISAMPACLPPDSDEDAARASMLRRRLERRAAVRRAVPELI